MQKTNESEFNFLFRLLCKNFIFVIVIQSTMAFPLECCELSLFKTLIRLIKSVQIMGLFIIEKNREMHVCFQFIDFIEYLA